jgi:hypothetical protein
MTPLREVGMSRISSRIPNAYRKEVNPKPYFQLCMDEEVILEIRPVVGSNRPEQLAMPQ